MAWTAPTTAIAGAIATASLWNTDVRDNTLYLKSVPFNRCVAFNNAAQTVTAAATTDLTLNSEDVDTATMHSTSSNTHLITIPSGGGGFYHIVGHARVGLAAGTDGDPELHLEINGTAVRSDVLHVNTTNSPNPILKVHAWLALAAADTVNLSGQAVTNNTDFGSATAKYSTRLSVVGPLPGS